VKSVLLPLRRSWGLFRGCYDRESQQNVAVTSKTNGAANKHTQILVWQIYYSGFATDTATRRQCRLDITTYTACTGHSSPLRAALVSPIPINTGSP
jgi:hypothetical protein